MKSPDKKGLFSTREVRALLWLLPVLAVVSWLVWEVANPRHENSLPSVLTDGQMGDTVTGASAQHNIRAKAREEGDAGDPSVKTDGNESSHRGLKPSESQSAPKLFAFDPNTVQYHDLVRLGFTRGEALGIIKYRERGKVFEIPEDFAACYQVSEAMYLRLRPYIRIGEEYRLKPFGWAKARTEVATDIPAVKTDGNISRTTLDGESRRGSPPMEGWRSERPTGWSDKPLIELNSADSAALISVVGIGEKTVVSILDYRERLGGFVRAGQLAEVRGVTEQNYERIVTQIFVDTLAIKKLDINFAPAKSLAAHPYIRPEALRKLLKQRQLKGGWRTVGELKTDDIFTREELERLVPYLTFN